MYIQLTCFLCNFFLYGLELKQKLSLSPVQLSAIPHYYTQPSAVLQYWYQHSAVPQHHVLPSAVLQYWYQPSAVLQYRYQHSAVPQHHVQPSAVLQCWYQHSAVPQHHVQPQQHSSTDISTQQLLAPCSSLNSTPARHMSSAKEHSHQSAIHQALV